MFPGDEDEQEEGMYDDAEEEEGGENGHRVNGRGDEQAIETYLQYKYRTFARHIFWFKYRYDLLP